MKASTKLTVLPDIIIPDCMPLIHLVQAGQLSLLHEVGGVVVLVDVAVDEAIRGLSDSDATTLTQWIAAGSEPGSHHLVRVEATELGQTLALARQADPSFCAPNAIQVAIVEWLAITIQGAVHPTMVLSENSRISGVVARQGIGADIEVITTQALLALSERHEPAALNKMT